MVSGSSANSRIFITTPKFSEGVPISLGYVISPTETGPNPIIPYPDYSWHSSNGTNCNLITSVFRVWIDECRQLWVLDTGVINNVMKCPPQLLVFDLKLKVNPLIWQYKFPDTQFIRSTSLFITPVSSTMEKKETLNYWKKNLTDCRRVGSSSEWKLQKSESLHCWRYWKRSHRLRLVHQSILENHKQFRSYSSSKDCHETNFSFLVSSESKQWKIHDCRRIVRSDGRLILIGPVTQNSTVAAFSLLPCVGIVWRVQNSFKRLKQPKQLERKCHLLCWLERRSNSKYEANPKTQLIYNFIFSQSVHAMDRNGNLWFVMLKPLALVCWDSSLPYTVSNFRSVLQDDLTLQFASGLKIVTNTYNEDEIVIVTNRFQVFRTSFTLKK